MFKKSYSPNSVTRIVLCLLLAAGLLYATLPEGLYRLAAMPLLQDCNDSASCLGDCPGVPWSLPKVHQVRTIDYGNLLVKYRQRRACDDVYEVYVDSFIPLNQQSITTTPPLDSIEMSFAVWFASRGLIVDNPMDFPPSVQDSDTVQIRVRHKACWSRVELQDATCPVQYIGCADAAGCCMTVYEVSYLPGLPGFKEVRELVGTEMICPNGASTTENCCTEAVPVVGTTDCESACYEGPF